MDWGIFRPSRPAALCLILLSFAFVLMTARLTRTVQAFRSFLFYWVSPSQEAAVSCIHNAGELGLRIGELVQAHSENARLKEILTSYTLAEAHFREMTAENIRLRQILELKSSLHYEAVPAIVSGRDTQNWVQALWINKGLKDGIFPNNPVLATQTDPQDPSRFVAGVIGRVLECGPKTSKILLITDPLSSITVSLSKSGEQGLVTGQGSTLVAVEYLDPLEDVEIGEDVLTSGMGGIFPAGYQVGKVVKISLATTGFKRAMVKTTIPLNKVKDVLVLRKEPERESAETQP